MDRVEMVVLITGSRDEADRALDEIKRLERGGWIELTDFALTGRDSQGVVRLYESADAVVAGGRANAGELSRPLIDSLRGADSALPASESFALTVVMEERYAERVDEELESRGRTVRSQLRGRERQAALRGAVERAKTNVRWLQEVLASEVKKAERLVDAEKEEIESTIAAGRAQLGAEQEILMTRLRTLLAALEADLRENHDKLAQATGELRATIESRIEEIDRALAECHEDLTVSILDQMDAVAGHALELQVKGARANAEAADMIQAQLHELQVRMRKYRAELTAILGLSSARVRHCMDHLRVAAALGTESRQALEERIHKLEASHQTVKADVRRLEKEGPRAWHETAGGIRQSWQALCESVGRAERGCL
jgi:hypothetical protein